MIIMVIIGYLGKLIKDNNKYYKRALFVPQRAQKEEMIIINIMKLQINYQKHMFVYKVQKQYYQKQHTEDCRLLIS